MTRNFVIESKSKKMTKKHLVITPLGLITFFVGKRIVTTERKLVRGKIHNTHHRTSRCRQVASVGLAKLLIGKALKRLLEDLLISTFRKYLRPLSNSRNSSISYTWTCFHWEHKEQKIIKSNTIHIYTTSVHEGAYSAAKRFRRDLEPSWWRQQPSSPISRAYPSQSPSYLPPNHSINQLNIDSMGCEIWWCKVTYSWGQGKERRKDWTPAAWWWRRCRRWEQQEEEWRRWDRA